ncbi:MAG: penicillin-binding protein [Micavibrio aeruginosavorus]|uniref:Penicillin-binding protein n=1 Tax=Micavibrio aeruginosavorus TaxID=349221 RepID=A0A2W5A3B9_9BACT|nr:MAG: penicillin-binding protein [Micavibrio aeruginosavorus]
MAKKANNRRSNAKDEGGMGAFMKTGIKWAFVCALWGALLIGLTLAWFARELPDITEQMIFERRPTITIKANDGTIIDRYGDIKGDTVSVKELPPHVPEAILAIEDRRFYYHFGIDPIGIARAFAVNIVKGTYAQGGSTITQQLAKNLFLSRDRTLKRKVQEAMLALWLETKLTKDEILSAYLNRVYLGAGAYGIDAASRVYFNKSAKELTIREAATLAGLLKAPSRYSPSSNPSLSAQRTRVVLAAMHDAGYLKDAEFKKLDKLPPAPPRKPSSGDTIRYFTDYVVSQIEGAIGIPEEDIIVETTLDKDIQARAESSITNALQTYGEQYKVTQGAAMIMALDGAVVAMVGGRDYDLSEYNRVTHALRSPGSSFKPIVYLAALEHGWNPNSTIMDSPITINGYTPKNYGGEYFGEVTLTEALTRSLNTVSVQLMQDVGASNVISLARRLGITAMLEPNLSLALGSNGVPMIEMTTAYATLGRGGVAVEPFAIINIKNAQGTTIYERPKDVTARQVIARGYVYQLTGMMQNVVQYGTGRAAQGPYTAAGKTGTSQESRDAWFIGFTNQYAGAVWVGNDDNSPMKRVTGGMIPASVWRDIMTTASGKPAKSYYNIRDVSNEFSFDDLLGRLIGSEQEQNPLTTPQPEQEQQQPQGNEVTPMGRHQWQFND